MIGKQANKQTNKQPRQGVHTESKAPLSRPILCIEFSRFGEEWRILAANGILALFSRMTCEHPQCFKNLT